MEQQQNWRKLNGQRLRQPIVDEVREAIVREKQMGHQLKVCIGTDSQVKGKETEFATVIVFIRKGKGGFMYIHNEITRQKMSIKQRMLVEVSKSIDPIGRGRGIRTPGPLLPNHGAAGDSLSFQC